MANITVTEVDTAIPEFWANLALGALRANTVMARLVNRDFDSAVASAGDVVNVNVRGGLSVNDKVANTQITLQTPSNSKKPVTLNKHKEVSWLIEDAASAKAIEQAIDYVQDAGIALGEQIDRDLLGLYTQPTDIAGTAGVDLSVNTILSARQYLNNRKCPVSGRVMVISSKDDTALLKLEQFTNSQWDMENAQALKDAALGRKYGFDFFMDQQVVATGASPTTYNNMAFHRDAFVLVTRPLPLPPAGSGAVAAIVEDEGVGIRITRSYSQKDGGVIWTLDCLYGVAEMRALTHACQVRT